MLRCRARAAAGQVALGRAQKPQYARSRRKERRRDSSSVGMTRLCGETTRFLVQLQVAASRNESDVVGIAPWEVDALSGAAALVTPSSLRTIGETGETMAAERAVDVIVVGGGAMGSAAAWRLARAGHRVRLLEQFAFGHEHGSSHGPSRMIRLAYPAPEYVQLGQEAFRLWDELQLEGDSGEALLLRTHGMNVGLPHADAMEEVADTLDTLGVPYERLDSDELRRRYPQYTFPEGSIGIYQEDYGILAASRCVAALAARARAEGADLRDEEPVVEIVPDGEGVAVRTTRGTYQADRVILTAGSWLQPLLAPLGIDLPLTVLQEQLAFFRVHDQI